MIKNIENPKGP
ncbi:hypothetical protein VCNHCC008D_002227A, partial [Vibrio cholerae O1 str. NHCC-008D]